MSEFGTSAPRAIPAVVLIHQEGVIAVIAMLGLGLTADGIGGGLAPRGSMAETIASGVVVGAACIAVLWLMRRVQALEDLERWQRQMVAGWSFIDAVAVAVFSGLAEEALIRALLQPILGLLPAALLFAALHVVPNRRLWLWPLIALAIGTILGLVFDRAGYPAVAAAHITINAFSLLKLRRESAE
jgi:membrane protease YdiL (CAAX protease family)